MDRIETTKILAVLKATYPHYYNKVSKEEAENVVSVWQSMLEDYDYQTVSVAVKAFITSDASGFPPTIGQIIDKILKLREPADGMSEMEAWNRVKKAISNSGYCAREEFEQLPPVLKRLVGGPQQLHQWSQMNSEHLNTVVQSNFMRSYTAVARSEREMQALPNRVKELVGIVTENWDKKLLN